MSRRFSSGDPDFGSDSFLDIVCNIVGILIILIVVVGVQVQQQPPESPITLPANPILDEQDLQLQQQQVTLKNAAQQRRRLVADQKKLQRVITQLRSARGVLQQEDERLSAAVLSASNRLRNLTSSQHEAAKNRQDSEQQLAMKKARVDELELQVQNRQQEIRFFSASLAESAEVQVELTNQQEFFLAQTLELREQLQAEEQQAVSPDRLLHRLSPLGKPVESGEVHFRLDQGRISEIPLETLLDLLRSQLRARQSVMFRLNEFRGETGAISGYSLLYEVEKRGPSPLQALQTGDNRIIIQVSRWELRVEEQLFEESTEDAVRSGARFRSRLETLPPESAVTIWVYENSFTHFAALRELAHSLQLRVAARPLPDDAPIIGSPGGSRSSAQ